MMFAGSCTHMENMCWMIIVDRVLLTCSRIQVKYCQEKRRFTYGVTHATNVAVPVVFVRCVMLCDMMAWIGAHLVFVVVQLVVGYFANYANLKTTRVIK